MPSPLTGEGRVRVKSQVCYLPPHFNPLPRWGEETDLGRGQGLALSIANVDRFTSKYKRGEVNTY